MKTLSTFTIPYLRSPQRVEKEIQAYLGSQIKSTHIEGSTLTVEIWNSGDLFYRWLVNSGIFHGILRNDQQIETKTK